MLPDETIARMMRKKRQQEKKGADAAAKEEQGISEEELMSAIKAGEAVVEGKMILFRNRKIFQNRLSVYLPGRHAEIQEGNKQLFQMADLTEAISIQFALDESRREAYSYQEYKNMLKEKFNSLQMVLKWKEEGAVTCESGMLIRYLDYLVHTGLAAVHNKFLFFPTSFGLVTCNMNYDEKEKQIYTPVMNAITRLIEVEE